VEVLGLNPMALPFLTYGFNKLWRALLNIASSYRMADGYLNLDLLVRMADMPIMGGGRMDNHITKGWVEGLALFFHAHRTLLSINNICANV
jgi:hypothetical protein